MTGVGSALLLAACTAAGSFAIIAIVARASRSWMWRPLRLGRCLESRWAPVAAGLVTALIVRIVWGSFDEPGVIHDERAYLLQAAIFASGHWTAAAPPIPAFFEQMHVFVEPAVFAKYPPAHAMMLAPGIWLGMPGLMPALLAGAAGALTFWLARRLSNTWVALLTWMLWTTAPATLIWATSYLSESTSTVMWLAAASGTVLWLETQHQRYLIAVAAALAWGFEARPLTMVALAVPIAFVIGRKLIELGSPRLLAAPLLVGTLVLGLGPAWNAQTLGDWKVDPYPQYSRTYFPFDKPGFGVDPAPPLRPVPVELLPMDAWSRRVHAMYMPATMPLDLVARVGAVLYTFSGGWRVALGILLLGSFFRPSGPAWLSLAASLTLFVAYLSFAHPAGWVVYYFELLPVLCFLAAGSLVRLLDQAPTRTGRGIQRSEFERGTRSAEAGTWNGSDSTAPASLSARQVRSAEARTPAPAHAVARASTVIALLLVPLSLSDLVRVRNAIDSRNAFNRQADSAIRMAPPDSIIFVRYPPSHDSHQAVTRNEADLASARTWIVYDRGAENARLLAAAPHRKPYLLDTSTFQLEPLIVSGNESTSLLGSSTR